jgi:hypothetical protein
MIRKKLNFYKDIRPDFYTTGENITIEDAGIFLSSLPDSKKNVIVSFFKTDGTAELFEIESISINNGHCQININEK